MSQSKFKQDLFDGLLNLLWRQWTRLGVPGQITSNDSKYVLDPEALLLFSAGFCRYDQRLFDLVIDWLRINGAFINIQRLKSLAAQTPGSSWHSPLGYIAAQMSRVDGRKWSKFAGDLRPATVVGAKLPMFVTPDETPAEYVTETDEIAAVYGLSRSPYRPSAKASLFPTDDCATVLLQLRGIFGLSARAETILTLLTKDVCKIQDIADVSCFSWKSIQDVLTELCASPLVTTVEQSKRGRYYLLKSPQKVRKLLDVGEFCFPDWPGIYHILTVLWETVANPRLAHLSERTFRFEIERVFAENVGKTLLDAGVDELKFLNSDEFATLPELLEKI